MIDVGLECLLFSEAAAANQVAVWVWMIRAERTKRDFSEVSCKPS